MDEKLFVIEFEKVCWSGCKGDITVKLIKAKSYNEAYELTYKHRNKFYPDCPFSVREIEWVADNTAYVYYDFNNC